MPQLTVMVGLPASGKSTFVEQMEAEGAFVYSTDRYIEEKAALENSTYDEVFANYIDLATGNMNTFVGEAIASNRDVVWDQTNLAAKKRRRILSRFPKVYRKRCICFMPPTSAIDTAELHRRLASRPGKTIPKHIVESMFNSFSQPTVDEGFDTVGFFDIYGHAFIPVETTAYAANTAITNL